MYSKIYSITVPADNADALMAHYDDQVASAVRESEHHIGHQMVEVERGSYLLVSNYNSKQDAEVAMTMVQKLIALESRGFWGRRIRSGGPRR